MGLRPLELADKLFLLARALNLDRPESWMKSVGLDRDTKGYDKKKAKTGMKLLWRYLHESPAMKKLFSLEPG